MRSSTPARRRPRRRGPTHGFLAALAGIVDHATVDDPGHVLVHVEGPVHPDVNVGFQRLEVGVHPFEALAGFTAPPSWTAFGVRARGRAHHLAEPEPTPQRVTATFVVDRTGAEASVLRRGE